jgi:hypothetical protein
MESVLATWIEHQNQQNMPLSPAVIEEKARSLYETCRKIPKNQMILLQDVGGSTALNVVMLSTIP